MKSLMKKLEDFLEIGGTKKDITFLVISGIALICSIFKLVPTKIDIALVEDKVEELLHLFALSKKMMATIKLNLTFSLTLNFIAIILAITGILHPVVGALVHNAGSVMVIINSALLLKWKK